MMKKKLVLENKEIVVGVVVEIIEVICDIYILHINMPIYATCRPGTGGGYLCSHPIGKVEWN